MERNLVAAESKGGRFRQWLSRIFGIQEELRELRSHLIELAVDPVFNIYTRTALVYLSRRQPRQERLVLFLDFDGIHRMNAQLGYEEVNRRVRSVMDVPLRSGDLVGRWFSGDEIVIVFGSADAGVPVMNRLRRAAKDVGLSFTAALGTWSAGEEELEDAVSRLIPVVQEKKALRGPVDHRSRVLLSEAV